MRRIDLICCRESMLRRCGITCRDQLFALPVLHGKAGILCTVGRHTDKGKQVFFGRYKIADKNRDMRFVEQAQRIVHVSGELPNAPFVHGGAVRDLLPGYHELHACFPAFFHIAVFPGGQLAEGICHELRKPQFAQF